MKVLLSAFACAPNRGSEPGVGWNWATALAKNNQVWVVTREENRKEIELYRKTHEIPFEIVYFGIDFFEKNNRFPYQKNFYTMKWQDAVIPFLKKLHDKVSFDICHHITYASYKYPTRLYELGIPLIVGPVGGGEMTPASCKKAYSIKNQIVEAIHDLQIRMTTSKKSFYKMCEYANYLFVTTQETYDKIPLRYQYKCEIMQTIGITEEEIDSTKKLTFYESGDTFRVLYVGNLIAWKGVGMLPDIAKKLKEKGKFLIEVVGDGAEKENIINRAREYQVEEMFSFIGKVPKNQVAYYMDNAHGMIFPSYHDSGAMVVLEAMARKLPVIVLGTGGPAINVSEKSGIKINPNQSYEAIVLNFVDEIVKLRDAYLYTPDVVAQMEEMAVAELSSKMTWNVKAVIMQEYYERCLKERNKIK